MADWVLIKIAAKVMIMLFCIVSHIDGSALMAKYVFTVKFIELGR